MRIELKEILDQALANPGFKPKNGITHCNEALQFIATSMGCDEFKGMIADDIYKTMVTNASGKWAKVDPSDATIWALSNGLSVAGLPSGRLGETHGHVAAVAPVGQQYSPSFKIDVPVVCNIGSTVWYMKTSEAFPVSKGMPDFFTYAG